MWRVSDVLCPWFILNPEGESHSHEVEVCTDTSLGLIVEENVQQAEAAVSKATQDLRSWDQLPVTVIAEHNPECGGITGGQWRCLVCLCQ